MVASLDTGEQYGIGIKKGNTRAAQGGQRDHEAAKQDGTYNEIYKKWFGTEPDARRATDGRRAEPRL